MIRTIGFKGGALTCKIGPKEDVLVFFQLVNKLVVKKHSKNDWSLITDRFYKRYLRWDELKSASALMQQIHETFMAIPTNTVDWCSLGVDENTRLRLQEKSLAGVFERFFTSFNETFEDVLRCKIEFDLDQPLRIVVADIPELMKDKLRPLANYDNLEGEPFWLR